MQSKTRGGLFGKERMLRSQRRASRMYAQQLLDDYLDPETSESQRERHIPIRSRSDFLPAVSCWTEESEDRSFARSEQLDLPLKSSMPKVNLNLVENESAIARKNAETPNSVSTNRFVPKASFQPVTKNRSTDSFDIRRFLFGCLLGGAAASVVLAVVSTIF